eukprot:1450838-Karenia_brevis.AAC.1
MEYCGSGSPIIRFCRRNIPLPNLCEPLHGTPQYWVPYCRRKIPLSTLSHPDRTLGPSMEQR